MGHEASEDGGLHQTEVVKASDLRCFWRFSGRLYYDEKTEKNRMETKDSAREKEKRRRRDALLHRA
jgi:hypothetical protein